MKLYILKIWFIMCFMVCFLILVVVCLGSDEMLLLEDVGSIGEDLFMEVSDDVVFDVLLEFIVE